MLTAFRGTAWKRSLALLLVALMSLSSVAAVVAAPDVEAAATSCSNWGKSWWSGNPVGLNFKAASGWCTELNGRQGRLFNDRPLAPDSTTGWFSAENSVNSAYTGYLTWGTRTWTSR